MRRSDWPTRRGRRALALPATPISKVPGDLTIDCERARTREARHDGEARRSKDLQPSHTPYLMKKKQASAETNPSGLVVVRASQALQA